LSSVPPQAPPKQLPAASPLRADGDGILRGSTFEEMFRLARVYCASKMLPKAYDTPEKVLTAMQFCAENGLKFLTSVRQIAVINGTPSPWGELPLAMVMSKARIDIAECIFNKAGKPINRRNENLGDEVWGAECEIKRTWPDGREREVVISVTVDDMKRAKLWDNSGKLYGLYPKRMLQMRARSQALKDVAPDVLSGIAIAEYDFHVDPSHAGDEPITVKDNKEASDLNRSFGKGGADKNGIVDAEVVR
jgi:hypothetical protein